VGGDGAHAVQGAPRLSRPAGTPVEWIDQYAVSDDTHAQQPVSDDGGMRARPDRRVRQLRPLDPRSDAEVGAVCRPTRTPFKAHRRARRESWCSTSPTTATHC
jgi:hypothetical protein